VSLTKCDDDDDDTTKQVEPEILPLELFQDLLNCELCLFIYLL